MPEFARLEGIIFRVFSNDHLPPHIHVFHGEFEALLDIRETTVFAGRLPKKKMAVALTFVAENRAALLESFYFQNPDLQK